MARWRASAMDRRSFVRSAGLAAAGSVLGYSSVGCAANEIYAGTNLLPTLASCATPAPTPVAGMTYLRASEIGCALDCDLASGLNKNKGGAATDDGPAINAAMAGATASNPITLLLDGSALISGLFLPAGGYWGIAGLGCGAGFFIKPGTNNDGIHNGGPTAAVPSDPGVATPGLPVPARGSSVSLSNFTLNGNAGNGLNGDSTSGYPQGTATDLWYFGINLMNLNNITIENVVVVNAPSYHIRLSNVGNALVSGCTMNSNGPNSDGVHCDGPANDITISNCSFTTLDDAIALNCPEGYTGNISGVTVTGCTFASYSMIRLYTIAGTAHKGFSIDSVTVSNCTGTLVRGVFLIGEGGGSLPQSVASLSVTNCNLMAPAVLDLSANFGAVTLTGVTLTPINISAPDTGFAFARTIGYDIPISYIGTSIAMENCILNRTGNYPVAALILEDGSTIGSLEFNGFAVVDPPGTSYTPAQALLNIVSGSIGQLVLDAVTSAKIAGPVSAGGFSSIGSVSGAGVLATGWPFPDAVMANGVPYLSANSNLPSIKVGGVIQPYP
jgi:hypothetical protein